MVGPVVKVDPNLLPHSPNLFWLGGRDYQQLPNYCKAFDVCIMPFALNAATEFINPTKALEYFATGRPVVSTHVKDVVRQYSELVHLARNQPDDFIQACQRALHGRGGDRLKRAVELARSSSWENTVQKMQGLIKEAITKDQRPSTQRVEPLPDTEIAYSYAATPGS
jgi:glycosyltransferase involved in cell wall biosynthesis